ncbi:MAG: UvrB/UvrC motif-containing protein [Planctomycetota bacterium]|jgi:protein arginine kinase activator
MEPCQSCGKNPATVHLTEIVKDESGEDTKQEMHLCEECAQKQGVGPLLTPQSFLGQLVDPTQGATDEELSVTCPLCGLTYAEFRQRGRLGCSSCYKLFREGLCPLLERVHGSTQHLGKIPSRAGSGLKRERELTELKRELSRVVQREEYEAAAELRDRIRTLEEE